MSRELLPLSSSLRAILMTMISMAPTGPRMKPPIISGRADRSNSAKGESTGTEKLKYISTKATAPHSAAIVRRRSRSRFMYKTSKYKMRLFARPENTWSALTSSRRTGDKEAHHNMVRFCRIHLLIIQTILLVPEFHRVSGRPEAAGRGLYRQ